MNSERDLAAHYNEHGAGDEWGEPETVARPERLDVTISVRFTEVEIAAVREAAARIDMKPTAFIRHAAMAAAGSERSIPAASVAEVLRDIDHNLEALRRAAS